MDEKKEEQQCGKQSTVEYAWAGQICSSCEEHANGMAHIAQAIGAPFNARLIENGEPCKVISE